jgi:hypothetical protein
MRIVNNEVMSRLDEAFDHVGAHPSQTDHAKLHRWTPFNLSGRPPSSREDPEMFGDNR